MLDEDGFEYLKEMSNGNLPTRVEIYLRFLSRIKHLWRGVIKPPSLYNLRILKMKNCPSVKSLFSGSLALCMMNIQCISIFDRGMLEEIVSMDIEQNEVTKVLEFPNLTDIILRNLKNFKSFRFESNKGVGVL